MPILFSLRWPNGGFFYVLAAVLLLLGGAGCDHGGSGPHSGGAQSGSGAEQWKKLRLPDGTDIVMKAGTVVRLSPEFGKSNREVEFGGEAMFDVAGDAGKPFVVHTKNLVILVLGTRFRIDAWPDKAGEEVDLLSGKLKVTKSYTSKTDNQPETLEAGDMVMINREIDLMEKEKLDSAELKAIEKMD